jgi:hypothetical protein
MANAPDFDLASAHRYFSAHCFNSAWELIDKPQRSPEEDEEMLRLSLAATWHWTQRPDCAPTNLSIGYWQTARIYALLDQADNARRYAQMCLEVSQAPGVEPFFRAYAYEALARAEAAAGEKGRAYGYLTEARHLAEQVEDAEEKAALLADLETVR